MSKIIEKVVQSKYAPHDRNVSWLDVNHKIPVKKYYINGKWVEVSGGGSGCNCNLPEPHKENNGQVLGVVTMSEPISTDYILQNTTLSSLENHTDDNITTFIIPNGYNPELYYDGQELDIVLTIYGNNVTMHGVAVQYGGNIVVDFGNGIKLGSALNNPNLYLLIDSCPDPSAITANIYHNEYDYQYGLTDAANVFCPTDVVLTDEQEEQDFFAKFNKLPEAGKAYFIPFMWMDETTEKFSYSMLPCYIQYINEQKDGNGIIDSIHGSCIQLFSCQYAPMHLTDTMAMTMTMSRTINASNDQDHYLYLNIQPIYADEMYDNPLPDLSPDDYFLYYSVNIGYCKAVS